MIEDDELRVTNYIEVVVERKKLRPEKWWTQRALVAGSRTPRARYSVNSLMTVSPSIKSRKVRESFFLNLLYWSCSKVVNPKSPSSRSIIAKVQTLISDPHAGYCNIGVVQIVYIVLKISSALFSERKKSICMYINGDVIC